MGCPSCGVVAHGHGRVEVRLVDAPCVGRPVRSCGASGAGCAPSRPARRVSFVEQDERVARPRALLTVRACRWAIEQIRREHASVNGLAPAAGHRLATRCGTSIRPLLQAAAADESRFDGVDHLGRR